jgi:hypothetical protein
MRTFVLDFGSDVHDAARDFWEVALAGEMRRGTKYPEYHVLEHPAALGTVMVQDIGDGGSRIHLDIETDDPVAEVARLISAGATLEQEHEEWTVLRDPAGLLFCVVPVASDDFAALSRPVGDLTGGFK